jgi:hypothetical protein
MKRNMEEFLRLLSLGKINPDDFAFEDLSITEIIHGDEIKSKYGKGSTKIIRIHFQP